MSFNIDRIKPMKGHVLIRIVKPVNDSVKFQTSGVELFIPTDYEPDKHITVRGEVVKVCDHLNFNPKNIQGDIYRTIIEVEKGDFAYFSYHSALMCLGSKASSVVQYPDEKYFIQDEKLYIFLPYSSIYFVRKQNGRVVPVNGNVICEKVEEEVKNDHIIIPDAYKTQTPGLFKVIHSGRGVFEKAVGPDQTEKIDPNLPYGPGDFVVPKAQYHALQIEYELHKTIGFKPYWAIHHTNIAAWWPKIKPTTAGDFI